MSFNIQLEDGYKQIAGNGKPAEESVLYYTTKATFPVTGESEKLYVDKSTGKIFTWNTGLTKYVASGITKADGISYDNTSSGLTAEVVQDAIDETVAKINDIELFKFPNATIIGTPTINNGQVSGFSATNYMKFPFIVNMQGRPFTIDIAFTTGTDITNQQNIIDGIDHGIAFAIRSGKFIIVLGSKTGEWDISGGEKISLVTVQPQTTYRVRISWDGSVYKFEYSTNGESYTEDTTMRVSSSLSLFPTQINIGVTSGLGGIFSGIINMNYCSLTISDKVVWTGMDDVGLATRMAVDMSNIDEAGVNKVKSIIGDVPTLDRISDVAGICLDLTTDTISRLASAIGKTHGEDFNTFKIFGNIKRCNVSDDGRVTAYYGDPNFKEDGSNGQVMVEIPKVYYRVDPLILEKQTDGIGYHLRKANYYVCGYPLNGFKVHPAFIDKNKNEREFVYVSAYEAGLLMKKNNIIANDDAASEAGEYPTMDLSNDTLVSVANVKPISGHIINLTRANSEQLAKNRGVNWHSETVQIASLIQLLMLIEYAGNLQNTLARGVVDDIAGDKNYSVITGGTSSLGNNSGSANGTDGRCSISYRGIENPWGNIWKFIAGVNIKGDGAQKGGIPYICNNYNYNEDTIDGYSSAGFTLSNSSQWITAFGYSEYCDWLFMASETSSTPKSVIDDQTYITLNLNEYRIAILGGAWADGIDAGGFDWNLSYDSSMKHRAIGARLCLFKDKNDDIVDRINNIEDSINNIEDNIDSINNNITELAEKKANKTFIESVDSETHIVTVPDDVAGFAAVKMIGGKTVKSKNLITFPYAEIGDTYFEEQGVRYTVQADNSIVMNGKNESSSNANTHLMDNYTLHKGIAYTLSGIPSYAGLRIRFVENNTGEQIFNLTNQGALTVIPDRDIIGYLYISAAAGTTFDNFIVKPMLEYGDVAHEYEPYIDGIHSAVVNKITSESQYKNIFDGKYYFEYPDSTDGIWTMANSSFSVKVPVEAGKTYYVVKPNKDGNRFRLWMYADRPEIGSVGIRKLADSNTRYTATVTVEEGEKYIGLFVSSGSSLIKPDIYIGELPYEEYLAQHYRTEVSVPKEILDLPDYGCSAGDVYNYIDFEEMKYYHNVGSADLENLAFSDYVETYGWSLPRDNIDVKPLLNNTDVANLISDKYDTVYLEGNNHMAAPNRIGVNISGQLFVNDGSSTERPKGIIYYEKTTPEIIDISSILYPFKVESGGTITFENEHNLDINNTVLYKKEVL